ncbi:UvrD-helicase domain-containing protein [Xanthomonas campestris pv. merremiae]|uniref:UvrD-helicase domain-containing protein n=1 Tax=Xanthomonas citri TaxID=346 RepID=UPI000B5C3B68|nr:UvrD-helicase domain-containing protein [Xanthomonas citri]ASK98194.1 DNA helicase UvrD [Xanthomonas citri pv. vignicola]MBV6838399.1 UvrD-helicase domain-containing protein [Xanthomonas campestris pv. merremiae]MBZ3931360.1 DNA helicase UvrD [Xanthomonas campestris pv. merremiae]MCC8565045.1 UvrD-helicase domain-containing protein [Xanthomonas citri pv. fuscans]
MDATEAARQEAERLHRENAASGGDPTRPLTFALLAATRRGLDVYPLQAGDSQLKGGKATFDSQAGGILYEDVGSDFDRAFLIAHELGHVVLEGSMLDMVTVDVEPERSMEDAPVGIDRVLDYGSRERREIKMDLFAREFLLPRSVLRGLHITEGLTSDAIAKRFGAPLAVVQQQLLDALLVPPAEELQPAGTGAAVTTLAPDPSQIRAAAHRGLAFQLQAGPGTGKTRTLVRRIEGLLADGVDPTTILVLTFSNKAANELCERIAASNPVAAAAMWIGTFHAFGLDIIRRFHDQLGLHPDPRLIDRTEAIELLEDEFPRLDLKHYRNLWDPALNLSDMLSAISRAKDEVIDSAGYRALAQSMMTSAGANQDAVVRAQKCLEVATLFEEYERLLTRQQSLDFGDLVALPVRLVESRAEVRDALRARHEHVLVDEYQDVNRASVRLLKAIVGEGRNLWVVGDARQSIYRFRGASATNIARFAIDFPGAQAAQLDVNYRSDEHIVDVFTEFARSMQASEGALPLKLKAARGANGERVELHIAESACDEVSILAASIEILHAQGIAYGNQVVLCASNARLNTIANGLEARGVPALHLGSLFERPEIKDLLALLSLAADPRASALVRVATMARYQMPLQDVMRVIEHLRAAESDPLAWLTMHAEVNHLAEDTRETLSCLSALFAGVSPSNNPWPLLAEWVIDRLGLAKTLYLAGDPQSRMQGLAIWQFLNFCRRQPRGPGVPVLRLLDRVRRLVLLSEDRGLNQLPHSAENINAVRLMTIHGSKGLEFDVVHLPGMVTSGLPRNNIPPRCPPPDGLIHGLDSLTGIEAVKAGHDEEEECLFFVALSRARDRLQLYAYARQADGRARTPSKFVAPIDRLLVRPVPVPLLPSPTSISPALSITWQRRPQWTDIQVNLFERCPRRFLYTHVLKLGGRRTETAFMKMHNVVSEVFEWLKREHKTTIPSADELSVHFEAAWRSSGPTEHGYADDYHRIGKRLVDFLIESRSRGMPASAPPILLGWAEGEILVSPDGVAHGDGGRIMVRRVKTGKQRSNAFDDIEYTILHLAAIKAYGSRAQVEVTYLTSETIQPMEISLRKLESRREKLQAFLQAMQAGQFPPKPESRTCPSCPSFFLCGDLPGGAWVQEKN